MMDDAMNSEFEIDLEKALNSATLTEVEEYGYCHLEEIYINEVGNEIKIAVYELESKTYLLRYVDKKCVLFRDITALRR
jgi:hypothetical protein